MVQSLRVLSVIVLLVLVVGTWASAGEVLYNGIELPDEWPPNYPWSREPMRIPYLESPPEVININVGRQLFVDDFLIEETTLERTFHRPILYQGKCTINAANSVWYDPWEKIFKMWHSAYPLGRRLTGRKYPCYATSKDGIHWEKPEAGPASLPKTMPPQYFADATGIQADTISIWIEYNDKDTKTRSGRARWRYKIFHTPLYVGDPTRLQSGDDYCLAYRCSADGIHWSKQPVAISGVTGDRTMAFYNPFRDKWAINIRSGGESTGRARAYVEADDAAKAVRLAYVPADGKVVPWLWADRLDPNMHGDVVQHGSSPSHYRPDLHHFDPIAYESLMLGYFNISHSSFGKGQVILGYSRDGFHFDRPDRRPVLPSYEREDPRVWNSVTGGCLVVGDRLYMYGQVRDGTRLAFLRRDGFASMGSIGDEGQLLTRLLRFSGKYLFVNTDCDQGELRVEAIDKDGKVVEPFTRDNCVPVMVDKTLQRVEWKGAKDLSALSGEPARFRFHLRLGELYSFWVSPDESGASYGYVGAGGPGYTSFVDTVGEGAYR